ncbi:MAG: AMP-binding protein [Thermodesulfobacteriota bacterium]|nr:AMP-binding protein [Thermodesulfobacteriota bacterium]
MSEEKFYCWKTERPPGHLNVGLVLKNAAISFPNKEIIDGNNDIHRSYKEVDERANRVANGLLTRGNPGDFVGVISRVGSIEPLETYFAIIRAGMIAVPLSNRLKPSEIENVLKYINAKALIFDEAFKSTVDQVDLKIGRYMFGMKEGGEYSYNDLLKYEPTETGVEIFDHTPICLGFTSGTTGAPKAYSRSSYANFLNHILYTISFDMTYQDIALNIIPPLTGISWGAGVMLARGTVINMDFDPVAVLKAIEKYKVTIMYGAPAAYSFMMMVPDLDKYDLSSLRAVASVGAVLPQNILRQMWEKITPNVYDHLGLQETGFIAVSKPDMKREKPEAVGPPTPLHELKIVDEEDKEKPKGEIGELIYRYPDGAARYWQNEEKTREAIKNGWFHSGDLGKFDEEGYLYVVGRLKDMIVSGGYNVFAIDVEDELIQHPKIAECAVIGLPDDTWGEKVSAVVTLTPDETCTEEEIINFCRDRMAHYKAPKSVFFDNIPRNLAGKVLKFKLVDKYKGK